MGKTLLLDAQFYHVFNKSIQNLQIFESNHLKRRFYRTLVYYNNSELTKSFSDYLKNPENPPLPNLLTYEPYYILKILAYCIMPDHYHLLVKCAEPPELSHFIQNIENSFTRFLNLTLKRKGTLWQSRFKHVRIVTNAQLSHVSRYIHLNPTSSSLVENPENWEYSSYREYVKENSVLRESWNDISFRSPHKYRKYVEDRKDYQRKLKRIRNHLI